MKVLKVPGRLSWMLRDVPQLYSYPFHGNKVDMSEILRVGFQQFDGLTKHCFDKSSHYYAPDIAVDTRVWMAEVYKLFLNSYEEYHKRPKNSLLNTLVFNQGLVDTWCLKMCDTYEANMDRYGHALGVISGLFNRDSAVVALDFIGNLVARSAFDYIVQNTYGSLEPLKGLQAKTDLSIGICTWLATNWAIYVIKGNVVGVNVPKDVVECAKGIKYLDEELLYKFTKGKNSKFIAYLEGKITVDELIESRSKVYKTRPTDLQLDMLMTYRAGDITPGYLANLKSDELTDLNCKYSYHWARYHNLYSYAYKSSYSCKDWGFPYIGNKMENYYREEEERKREKARTDRIIEELQANKDKQGRRIAKLKEDLKAAGKKKEKVERQKKLESSHKELEGKLKDRKAEIAELKAEIERKDEEIQGLKVKYSNVKKESRKLEEYKACFGELHIISDKEMEVAESNEQITDDEIIEALKDLDIVICSFMEQKEKELTSLGLNVRVINSPNSCILKSKFDIAVIYSKQCDHKTAIAITNRAQKLGAMQMYYSGVNNALMLRAIYDEVYN